MPAETLRKSKCSPARKASDDDRAMANRTLPVDGGAPTVDSDVWLLHVCYARSRDAEIRRLLVEQYQGYALLLARRMHREGGEPLGDLRQVAFEALLTALDRFDPERRCPFLGFASLTITGALKRYYRDFGWLMRVPRRVHELAAPIRRATDELTVELGHSPNLDEVAARVGTDVETLIEAQEAAHARSLGSLETSLTDDERAVRDVVGDVDPGFERRADVIDLRNALGDLTDDERELVRLYYFEDYTQHELADVLGTSQMQVSRLLQSVTRRLADRLAVVV